MIWEEFDEKCLFMLRLFAFKRIWWQLFVHISRLLRFIWMHKNDLHKRTRPEFYIINPWHVLWAAFACGIEMVASKQKKSLDLIFIMASLKKKQKKQRQRCVRGKCGVVVLHSYWFLIWLLSLEKPHYRTVRQIDWHCQILVCGQILSL